jgi:hypothetical protein
MIAYCLSQNINGQKLLEDIQNLVAKKMQQNHESKPLVLIIDIKEVVNDTTSHIPKIEYTPLDQ